MKNQPENPINKKIWKQINATLGMSGRMITNSKSRYHIENPGHYIIFNCHIGTEDNIFWWGDIDLTLDENKLIRLAALIGQKIYLFSEHDGYLNRYKGKPVQTEVAIYSCTCDGGTLLSPNINYSLIEISQIHEFADKIFGSKSKVSNWFCTELTVLNGLTPEAVCSTPEGKKKIIHILKKIKFGEFS